MIYSLSHCHSGLAKTAVRFSAVATPAMVFTFDMVFFDRDLGEERTGYEIAKWKVENNTKIKQGFKIVSQNSVGRFNISQLLNHYGYQEIS